MLKLWKTLGYIAVSILIQLSLTMGATAAGLSVNLSTPGEEKKSIQLYSASYALIIGIDNYRKGWPQLSNAVRDAREIAKTLEASGYEVTLVTDPDRANLIRTMREFFIVKGNDPNARLFMWFAGHGHTENDEGYIIPADGDAPEAGPGFRLTAIPIRDISSYVRLAQSKHVLSVFDSCFAGTVFDTGRAAAVPSAITQATTQPVRQFLTSGSAYQQVSDDGTFRELFIRLLTGTEKSDLNDDGYVTATEAGFYLSGRMTNLTQGRQTPRFGKLRDKDFDLGDFVLTAYSSKPIVPEPSVALKPTDTTALTESPPLATPSVTSNSNATGEESNTDVKAIVPAKPLANTTNENYLATVLKPAPKTNQLESVKQGRYFAICSFGWKKWEYRVAYDKNSSNEALNKARSGWGNCTRKVVGRPGTCLSVAVANEEIWGWSTILNTAAGAEKSALANCKGMSNSFSPSCKIIETVCG